MKKLFWFTVEPKDYKAKTDSSDNFTLEKKKFYFPCFSEKMHATLISGRV